MPRGAASPGNRLVGLAAVALLAALAAPAAPAGAGDGALAGHLYGTVQSRDGSATGAIVLGDTDNRFWEDSLTAWRTEPLPGPESGERPFRFRIFGLDLSGSDQQTHGQAVIPFGRIAELEPADGDTCRVVLKNGDALVLRANGGEFGDGMADPRVIAADGTETRIPWHRIERIRFADGAVPGVAARRLHGTVETEAASWTGPLRWDRDESVLDDILDGEVDGQDREVPLADVAEIRPAGPEASLLTLRDGTELRLAGTNDVNRHNRGIEVFLADGVRVVVPWERVQRVAFREAGASSAYRAFDGGGPIRGTVTTRDGKRRTGRMAWDIDERYDWETLDGTEGWLDWSIPFARIARLEPGGDRTRVVLRDGTERVLAGSNDVNMQNRGLRLWPDEGGVLDLHWREIEAVTLEPTSGTPAAGSGTPDPA